MDGSFHAWLEERGPEGCLMDLVDDATNTTLARLGKQETIWAAAGALRAWIERYGVPQSLYVDWKNLYKRAATAQERLRGEEPITQFGRMCAKLGIELIAASSPQAKGRVERIHGTHQDRLVKKLRRKKIATHAQANAYLEAEYLAEHNRRFARAAARPEDYHRRAPRAAELDKIFRLESERVISDDWVVRYDNRFFQLEAQSRHMRACFDQAVARHRVAGDGHEHAARVEARIDRDYDRLALGEDARIVRLVHRAAAALGTPFRTRATGGGSDANVFTGRGLEVANLACGMRAIHTVNEWVDVKDIVATAALLVETLRLNATT